MNRKKLFTVSAVLLMVAFVGATLLYWNEQQSAQAAQRNLSVLVREHSPSSGDPSAKVHIVEFLDPACETCRSFYPYVKQLMAAHPGKIQLSVRHVPFHRGSDYVVKVLEAARNQGMYWQTLDAVLASQAYWAPNHTAHPDRVWKPLERTALNLDRIRSDMDAPAIAQRIRQDLADAQSLKVTKTPEFFVNGRPLPSFGWEQLENLVNQELQAAYR